MIVATAGHIDHGKTVLVKALSGVDTDRLPEEKRRGMSIDLGFAYRALGQAGSLGFIDVPGHERFIANMLAGVTGIDYALLVVAADDGPMPQTREHLAILDLLGIARGAVALTKIDRVDGPRVAEATKEIRALIAETSLGHSEIFPVSGQTGEGIEALRADLDAAAVAGQSDRAPGGNFRLAVDRAFTLTGAGLVVTGTVFSGAVAVGDQLLVSPEGRRVRVRGLHAQNRVAERAGVGERCALNITGSDLRKDRVRRGSWLLAEAAHAPTARLDIRLRLLESERRALRHWTPVHVHVGAEHVTGRVAVLGARSIAPGAKAFAQLVLDREIGALAGDRVVLRDQSAQRTLGGGPVVDPFPPRRGRARPERLEALEALSISESGAALAALLEVSPQGVDLNRFAQARNLTAQEAEALREAVPMARVGPPGASIAVTEARADAVRGAVLSTLARLHQDDPGRVGQPVHALRREMPERVQNEFFAALLADLVQRGDVVQAGGNFRLPDHRVQLAPADAKVWARLEPLLSAATLRPPTIHELGGEVGMAPKAIERMLARIARLGLVVRVTDNRYFLTQTLFALGETVEAVAARSPDGTFSVAEFRDQTKIGRNLAIELLEYFDRAGFTARKGDRRRVMRPAREALTAA